jgi:hypothetical protein
MPPILEAPRRDKSQRLWETANCAYEHSVAWLQHPADHEWRLPRPLSVRTVPRSRVDLEVRFENLADEWEEATAFESVVTRQAMHPAYQRIIGMGDEVVPLILRRLRREPHQWFWALTAITGKDPAEGEATAGRAAEAWLEWGRAQGLVVD